jgi:hypothetical protein
MDESKRRTGMSTRTLWRGVLWIVLLWAVITLTLAASEVLQELYSPAASPAAPTATPRVDRGGGVPVTSGELDAGKSNTFAVRMHVSAPHEKRWALLQSS